MRPPKQLPEILEYIAEVDVNSETGIQAQKLLLRSENKVLLLRKALYDLKQTGKQARHRSEKSRNPTNFDWPLPLFAVYIDDIIVAAKDQKNIESVSDKLSRNFEMKALGQATYCLGLVFAYKGN